MSTLERIGIGAIASLILVFAIMNAQRTPDAPGRVIEIPIHLPDSAIAYAIYPRLQPLSEIGHTFYVAVGFEGGSTNCTEIFLQNRARVHIEAGCDSAKAVLARKMGGNP